MSNKISDAFCALKTTDIVKHYDCKTELRCKNSDKPGFAIAFKGDFSVNAFDIMVCGMAILGTMGVLCICKKLEKMKNKK